MVLFGENVDIFGKTAVFLGSEAGLGKYCTGGYGRIGVYRISYGKYLKIHRISYFGQV